MPPSVKELRGRASGAANRLANLVRRMTVRLSVGAIWELVGYVDADANEEVDEAEVWSGVGIWARPAAGRGEAIMVHVGGETGHPAAIALRDERTRAELEAAIGALKAGEIVTFSGAGRSVVYQKADGTIEARAWTGTAVPLATKADVDDLRNYIANQLTLPVVGATAGPLAAPPPPSAAGTTKLKGE